MGFVKNNQSSPNTNNQSLIPFGNIMNNNQLQTPFSQDYFSNQMNFVNQPNQVLQSQMPAQDYIDGQMSLITQPAQTNVNTGVDYNAYNDMIKADTASANYALNKQKAFDNSLIGKASPYVKGFAGLASGVSSLAGIWAGFQQLNLMKDQVNIAKDKWATTKAEMNRIKGVRDKLTSDYMA